MGKRELINLITDIFGPIGFKHKGNYWIHQGIELTKMINIQKSSFGDFFYINYGFIFNNLDKEGVIAHVLERLASSNKEEQKILTNCLDLGYEMLEQDRRNILKEFITKKVLNKIQGINSEVELVEYLKKRPTLNDIPLRTKEYLNLH